jgi:hypothetical protein
MLAQLYFAKGSLADSFANVVVAYYLWLLVSFGLHDFLYLKSKIS